jgi:hypothetical protein
VTLGELLPELAVGLAGIETSVLPDGATAWSRAGQRFAVVSAEGSTAEFGLDPAIAAAAARTPDVAASARGPGWVAFTPGSLDEHAADRAEAWFRSAHRRLGPRD